MDDKSLSQITFEFFGAQEEAGELLSGPTTPKPQSEKQPQAPKSTRGRKSLKEVFSESEQVEIPPDEILFQKQYYSIGEVATMFKVNTSLIRYWENEFDIIEPRKNRK